MVTEYENICVFCGRIAVDTHHLVYGNGMRPLSDKDELTVPVCRHCHDQIHQIGLCGDMSRIIGQLAWEKDYISKTQDIENAREEFRKRYGHSYL